MDFSSIRTEVTTGPNTIQNGINDYGANMADDADGVITSFTSINDIHDDSDDNEDGVVTVTKTVKTVTRTSNSGDSDVDESSNYTRKTVVTTDDTSSNEDDNQVSKHDVDEFFSSSDVLQADTFENDNDVTETFGRNLSLNNDYDHDVNVPVATVNGFEKAMDEVSVPSDSDLDNAVGGFNVDTITNDIEHTVQETDDRTFEVADDLLKRRLTDVEGVVQNGEESLTDARSHIVNDFNMAEGAGGELIDDIKIESANVVSDADEFEIPDVNVSKIADVGINTPSLFTGVVEGRSDEISDGDVSKRAHVDINTPSLVTRIDEGNSDEDGHGDDNVDVFKMAHVDIHTPSLVTRIDEGNSDEDDHGDAKVDVFKMANVDINTPSLVTGADEGNSDEDEHGDAQVDVFKMANVDINTPSLVTGADEGNSGEKDHGDPNVDEAVEDVEAEAGKTEGGIVGTIKEKVVEARSTGLNFAGNAINDKLNTVSDEGVMGTIKQKAVEANAVETAKDKITEASDSAIQDGALVDTVKDKIGSSGLLGSFGASLTGDSKDEEKPDTPEVTYQNGASAAKEVHTELMESTNAAAVHSEPPTIEIDMSNALSDDDMEFEMKEVDISTNNEDDFGKIFAENRQSMRDDNSAPLFHRDASTRFNSSENLHKDNKDSKKKKETKDTQGSKYTGSDMPNESGPSSKTCGGILQKFFCPRQRSWNPDIY